MASENTDSETTSDDDRKTNGKLQAPYGLQRIISQDDLSIKPEKKKPKKIYPFTPNPTSNTRKKNRKSQAESQKILELEAHIKSLIRDNRVLQRKLEKLGSTTDKKQKKMDNEREMRLAANKERFTLKQKLDKLQKAISARLKLLAVDFSKIDDITTALDTCFNVIQKLAKQLQQKEEELNDTKHTLTKARSEISSFNKNKKQINELTEKNKNLMETEAKLRNEIQILQRSMESLNEEKTLFKDNLDGKLMEIEGLKNENNTLNQENEELSQNKKEIETELNNSMEAVKTLRNELETMKNEHKELKHSFKDKCNEYDTLSKTYKVLKEKSIKALENKLKDIENTKKEEQQKMVKYKNTITTLHQEIGEKDKLIKSQKKQMKSLQNELDMSGFGDNKKFSQMSLLKKNVESMHSIIRDKDNQIKTLNNKLKQQK